MSRKISTHTPLTGRDIRVLSSGVLSLISTHTPLTGRDGEKAELTYSEKNFYSHAPYGT